MAAQTSLESTWLEREALRSELELARQEITVGAHAVKASLNMKARAKAFVKERPVTTAVASLAAGALATRVLPLLLWRKKGLLGKVTTEFARGMAGMALPIIINRLNRFRPAPSSRPAEEIILIPTTPTPTSTMTTLNMKGSWNQIKGKLKQKYAQITDNDLLFEEGKEEELLGRLQQKTGETKEALRDFIARI